MIPAGYMAKIIAEKPDWISSDTVKDIYSLSNCASDNFADNVDYIKYWKHNGFWLFNDPEAVNSIAKDEKIDLSSATMFYYEVYEYEYYEDLKNWSAFSPELSFHTDVKRPKQKYLQGFDVVTFYAGTNPEHSPLSCNALADEIATNQYCLFNEFSQAKNALDNGFFKESERGPYRIFAVYTLEEI
jgi:hypothetical protein